ncbi:MAG: alkaline phosphatase family protein [Tepidisphaeraceae bacterium]|jgi:predicted AlkP superfamily pyrophosphatase or phosphodiesterase
MARRKLGSQFIFGLIFFAVMPRAWADDPFRPKPGRNVIIFVADGLRRDSVNPIDSPTLYSLRQLGTDFPNSHSLFPTVTTPNASAIATGHYLGDTGDFGNYLYPGFAVYDTTNFRGRVTDSKTPFIENDHVIGDIDEHFTASSFLNEESLLAQARAKGYHTAAIGKVGPILIQDVTQGDPAGGKIFPPYTIIVDDSTGRAGGIPLRRSFREALLAAGLPTTCPDRSNGQARESGFDNGYPGTASVSGTRVPNLVQQKYLVDVTTRVVLPMFCQDGVPFALVFWSRDPDGTQHNQGDSLLSLSPGVNGPTSRNAVRNADNNLKQILDFVGSTPGLKDNTDIFVTSDHGFSTISKRDLDGTGAHFSGSYAASFEYRTEKGEMEVARGFLPSGFVAIDLSHALNLPLYDPDTISTGSEAHRRYKPVDPTIAQETDRTSQHPYRGDGVIGGSGEILGKPDAKVIVCGNGGSDLIYIPDHDGDRLKAVIKILSRQDYVSGLFVADSYGEIPGTEPLSAIDLQGLTGMPVPALVVNFRSFALDAGRPAMTQVEIADAELQQGQGMHGSFGRGDTLNNMVAIGPDFKSGFVDPCPAGNADLALTLATVLGLDIPTHGALQGRILREALIGGPDQVKYTSGVLASEPDEAGNQTFIDYQDADGKRYFDAAGYKDRTDGLKTGAQ